MHDLKYDLQQFPLRLRARTRRLWRRWNDDTSGASVVTTAVTLPLLILTVFGIFMLFRVMLVKWSFDRGVREAARYISEDAAFWERRFEGPGNLIDDAGMDLGVPPADYYDIEAKRIVASRLKDIFNYDWIYERITETLYVTVTEPALSELVESRAITLTDAITADQGADTDQLCDMPRKFQEGSLADEEWRHWNNIRFRVFATMDLPILWTPRLPFGGDNYTVTMHFANRAVGYVQCARWSGQSDAALTDKTRKYSREGPALPYRNMATPWYPTVTPFPTATAAPTSTITPTSPVPLPY